MKFGYQLLCVLSVVTLAHGALSGPAVAQFSQETKLVGTGAIGPAEQGFSVSLSGDGSTAIIGGRHDNPAMLNDRGAAWVFKRSHGEWTQQAKLVGMGAIGNADQGTSVALSSNGNTAIVGGPFDDNSGAAWVFQRSGRMWRQQAKLVGTSTTFLFGYSVSLSGDGKTAIVGAPFDNGEVGAAWVFTRSHGVWTQQTKLVGTGMTGAFATQGTSVAISGDGNTAVVGGFNDNDEVGAAWVFRRSHGVWTQQAKLVGTEAVGAGLQGYSASISDDGNTVIVGGPQDNNDAGAAWVFTRSHGEWTQQGPKLVGTGVVGPFQLQGISVSLSSSGNTAVVGGFADNNNTGAAWVFTRSHGEWTQQAKLVGRDAIGNAEQGTAVSISGDGNTVVMGGPDDNSGAGAVWIFSEQPVFAGVPGSADCHGQSVSALARQYGGLDAAAAAVGFASVDALQNTILGFCEG
jgi:hypothetical protein